MIDVQGEVITTTFVNLKGEPVERTPYTNPYNFDEYVVYISDKYKLNYPYCTEYSDRLIERDYHKFTTCYEYAFNHSGQLFYDVTPEVATRFLSKYLNRNIELYAILCGCNVSNGYPYWVFIFE